MPDDKTLNKYARLAGLMYLVVIAVFVAGDFLTERFLVAGDLRRTAANIRAAEPLYRIGLLLEFSSSVLTVPLAGAFYVLLKSVDRNLALFALLWRILEAAFGGLATIFKFITLNIYLGAQPIFPGQQQVLVTIFSQGSRATLPTSVIYFSAGSIVFFCLLFKSRYIRRLLAAFGVFSSVVAGAMGVATLVVPAEAAKWQLFWLPIFLAEITTGLLLLVRGVDCRWWNARSPMQNGAA